MALEVTEPKTVEAVVRVGINEALLDLRTIHPCKVTRVRADGTVDVDLMIHTVFVDDTSDALPSITQLPILYAGSGQYSVTFPIAVGDEGLALFAERDISKYLEDGETGPPSALRRHSLSDGMFMPTPISKSRRLEVRADTLLLKNTGTSIEITDGLIKMKGNVQIEGEIESTGKIQSDADVIADASAPVPVSALDHGHCYFPGPGSATISSTPSVSPTVAPPGTC